jgi:hypothetical protein
MTDIARVRAMADQGLSPAEKALAMADMERNRRMIIKRTSELSGGSAGVVMANIQGANIGLNKGSLNMAAMDAQLRRQGTLQALNASRTEEQLNQYKFGLKNTAFNQNQEAWAGLLKAGLANVYGSYERKNNQEKLDAVTAQYGTGANNTTYNYPTIPTGTND